MKSPSARPAPAYKVLDQPISDRADRLFGPWLPGPMRLNVGCAKNLEPGFINLDMSADVGADVVHDLNYGALPFDGDVFHSIMATHTLEHIHRDSLVPLIAEFYRVLRPGGFLVAVTPHGASDDAWENPHHRQLFTERTWAYFSDELYDIPHAGYGARQGMMYGRWALENLALVPYPEFVDDPDLDFKKKHYRNVFREVHAVMRKL